MITDVEELSNLNKVWLSRDSGSDIVFWWSIRPKCDEGVWDIRLECNEGVWDIRPECGVWDNIDYVLGSGTVHDIEVYFGCAPAFGEYIELRKVGGKWVRDAEDAIVQEIGDAEDAENKTARDPVDHYMRGGLECIDAMKAISTPEEFRGYLRLTALKYLWRLGEKDCPAKEAKKAKDYITWLYNELAKAE